jgi:hypothetical protein
MRYMLFIRHTEHYRGKTVPAALMKAMGEIECELRRVQTAAPGSE